MTSPTQRALALCKANLWPYAIVEHFNTHTMTRKDLWSIGDLIVLDAEPGVLLVQVCAGASHAARSAKVRRTIEGATAGTESELTLGRILRDSNALKAWLAKGNHIEVWSFAKKGARGKRKLFELRRERITLQPTTTP